MHHWKDNVRIQHLAYTVLILINPCCEETKASIIEGGGIELILSAIKLFLRTTTESDEHLMNLQRFAVSTLGALVADSFEGALVTLRAGGVPILIDVLREPFSNAPGLDGKVTLHSCLLLEIHNWSKFLRSDDMCSSLCTELFAVGQSPRFFSQCNSFQMKLLSSVVGALFCGIWQ